MSAKRAAKKAGGSKKAGKPGKAGGGEDFLTQDPPLRGQNYACLSFVSPEDAIATKQAMAVGLFLADALSRVRELANAAAAACEAGSADPGLASRLRDAAGALQAGALEGEFDRFASERQEELTRMYAERHGGRTSVRGIKVRGSFDTLPEAQDWARKLAKADPAFSVYVAQVGCWCPWSPNPDDISDTVYANESLNELMRGYAQNQEQLKEYHERLKASNTGARAEAPAP